MEWIKISCFNAQQNEVIILKRHDTVNLCYICDRVSCDGCVRFSEMAKKWRPRKSRLSPILWLLWVIVVHSFLDINIINKYKNNCKNLCLPFWKLARSTNLSGSINFYVFARKVRVAHTRGLQHEGIGISLLFTSIVRFLPDVLRFRISSRRLWRSCDGAEPEEVVDAS